MSSEINPFSPHLTKEEKQLVIDRCRESPAYFINIVKARSVKANVQYEMPFHKSWIDQLCTETPNDQCN